IALLMDDGPDPFRIHPMPASDTSPVDDQPASDSNYWYVWSEPKPLGPFLFKRLRQMSQEGRLSPEDRVRAGTSGAWMPAGNVPGLQFPDPEKTASTLAAESTEETQDDELESQAVEGFFASICGRIEDFWDELRWGLADRWSRVRTVCSWAALA